MRIISGKYRGRKLLGPSGLDLRPTGDRLKESLFSIFGSEVISAVVLDVFAGTGAIGIEALSRGARQAVFIECATSACRLDSAQRRTLRYRRRDIALSSRMFSKPCVSSAAKVSKQISFFSILPMISSPMATCWISHSREVLRRRRHGL